MSYKRHLAWMSLSQACFFAVQFVGSVIVARLLTPYDFGVYAIALAITGILSTLQAFGLNGFIVREQELGPGITRSVFTINLLLSFILAGLIAGLSPLGGRVMHEDGVRRVMLLLAILPVLGALEFLPATHLERAANFKAIALVNMGRIVAAQLVTVGLAFKGCSFMSLAFGQIAASIFSRRLHRHRPAPRQLQPRPERLAAGPELRPQHARHIGGQCDCGPPERSDFRTMDRARRPWALRSGLQPEQHGVG
jgi:O-antigen/teichoic acid export membrane protein